MGQCEVGQLAQAPTYSSGRSTSESSPGFRFTPSTSCDARGGGAYSIKFGNGWTTVVAFAGHHNDDVYGDLRRRLESAVSEQEPVQGFLANRIGRVSGLQHLHRFEPTATFPPPECRSAMRRIFRVRPYALERPHAASVPY